MQQTKYQYEDHLALPKAEANISEPWSPYAVTKYVNELYPVVFFKTYGFNTIVFRYFYVFGKRQNPEGAYAAVIVKWTASILSCYLAFKNRVGNILVSGCYLMLLIIQF